VISELRDPLLNALAGEPAFEEADEAEEEAEEEEEEAEEEADEADEEEEEAAEEKYTPTLAGMFKSAFNLFG